MERETPHHDAHPPRKIAQMVARLGVAKANENGLTLFVLAILAGAFISMGALFFTVVTTDTGLGFGLTRLVGGVSFCLGLILVVIAGAELFTGNNLIAMAWASGLVGTRAVLRNWLIVYLGNVFGCLGSVALAIWGRTDQMASGNVAATAVKIASTKADLTFSEGLARGILCNALVCLAVWLALGGRGVADKIVAIVFPITAFVAMGFEHSIANWFFLPYGLALAGPDRVDPTCALVNIVSVTIGNILGGTLLVAGVYWTAYMRDGHGAHEPKPHPRAHEAREPELSILR